MKMKHAIVMGHGQMLRKQHAPGHIPGHLARDIVPLGGGQPCIFIGIFLCQLLIFIAQQLQNGFIRGVGFPHQAPLVTVYNIFFGQGILVSLHQMLLDHILHMFHGLQFPALLLDRVQNLPDQGPARPVLLFYFIVCFLNGGCDFILFIRHNTPVPFLNPHAYPLHKKTAPQAFADTVSLHIVVFYLLRIYILFFHYNRSGCKMQEPIRSLSEKSFLPSAGPVLHTFCAGFRLHGQVLSNNTFRVPRSTRRQDSRNYRSYWQS